MFWELCSGTYYLHGLPPGRMENDLVLRLTLNLLVLVEIIHILLRGAAGVEDNKPRHGTTGSGHRSNTDSLGTLHREIRMRCYITRTADLLSIWKERMDRINRAFLRKELFSH